MECKKIKIKKKCKKYSDGECVSILYNLGYISSNFKRLVFSMKCDDIDILYIEFKSGNTLIVYVRDTYLPHVIKFLSFKKTKLITQGENIPEVYTRSSMAPIKNKCMDALINEFNATDVNDLVRKMLQP